MSCRKLTYLAVIALFAAASTGVPASADGAGNVAIPDTSFPVDGSNASGIDPSVSELGDAMKQAAELARIAQALQGVTTIKTVNGVRCVAVLVPVPTPNATISQAMGLPVCP